MEMGRGCTRDSPHSQCRAEGFAASVLSPPLSAPAETVAVTLEGRGGEGRGGKERVNPMGGQHGLPLA